MSRCFPFPPPGYERKAITDKVDLLKKEKHKEKKHKKEKKDREKREGNEKRDKDRNDEKHREKTDKKEKYRDKDSKKDKDKAKDKGNDSDEKGVSAKTKNHNGEKVIPSDGKDKNYRNDKKSPYIVDKRSPGLFQGYKAEKINQNDHHDKENKETKLVHELGRRINDDARGTRRPIENFTHLDQKKDEGMVRLVAKGTGGMAEVTEKNKNKKVQDEAADGMCIRNETRTRENAMVQVGVFQTSGGTTKTLEKNVFKKLEGKEKAAGDKPVDKQKKKDKEKKSHGKDKERDKEEEEKAKDKIQVGNIDPDKVRQNNKNHMISANSCKIAELPKDINRICGAGGNHKKRKDFEINGVLHADDFRPTKLPRPAPSPPIENGRLLEGCQTSIFHASDKQGSANNFKVENKERERNGTIEAANSSVSLMKLKPPKPLVNPAESSTRLPHPDSKYLSQIYSVPSIQELLDFDDQEWLFSGNDSEHKKPVIESSPVQETLQVWAEALQMGSADVCALPYVIPY